MRLLDVRLVLRVVDLRGVAEADRGRLPFSKEDP